MSTIIRTNQLTKSYGRSRGINDVAFDIQEGEVFGFLGPNGAGKTTTMGVLMGLLRASSGSATIGGLDCWKASTEVKKLVGYLPGEFTFDPGLRGAQTWVGKLSIFHLYGNPIFVGMDWGNFLAMTSVALVLLVLGLVQFRYADIEHG
jgi:ABC-type multidrug transport system ATPase subunit